MSSVSVVVPALDEEATIGRVIAGIAKLRGQFSDLQLIVADNGSEDATKDIAEKSCAVDSILEVPVKGKGAALRAGFAAARCEIVVMIDADLEYLPEEIPDAVAPVAGGRADVVYGSRYLGKGDDAVRGYRRWGNAVVTSFSNRCTGLELTDMETGIKAMRADVLGAVSLVEDGFAIEPELTAKLATVSDRFLEVPISYRPRGYDQGKKIRLRDGFAALGAIWRYRRAKLERGGAPS